MDEAAVVATEFVNSLDNLQQEFQFILTEIRLRDQSSSEIRDNIQRKEVELNTTMLKTKPPGSTTNKEETKPDTDFDNYLKSEYDRLDKLANEKLEWSNKLKMLIDKHVKRVNVDLVTVQQLSANLNAGNAPLNSPATLISNPFNQKAPSTPTPAALNKSLSSNSQKRPSITDKISTPGVSEVTQKKRKLSSLNPSSGNNTSKKSRQSSARPSESEEDQSIDAMEDESISDSTKGGITGEADEDENVYCYCQKKSYGEMIGCDNDDCQFQWFHLGCVNVKPPLPEVWYCTECKNKLGIQTLLEAERDGALIVQQARDYRTQKLKQARTDAQKEVQSMKEAKEDDFKSAQNDSSDSQSKHKGQVEKDTENALRELNDNFDKKKEIVVNKLLDRVTQTKN
ncbi:hypothetical protein E3Q10_01363 [Wallemia mellicola]|uniref:Chromatin modification-related protein n=1 Tax=Wallemia mellicola TaxID=1708541 RepID=A0A4T0QH72_9BASI|nr:hypothetical protein E3Q21_03386 [Wallemia mellicola]TIB84359.1 hypothetical protein E3Q20_03730 [Wallemia mellicola]TIB93782.1 hypothetical protein E3Q19_00966 [Wallemia mellicola]TIC05386.1 hypothetical protein E3Q16_02143 [Wallemia mellicola]TIC13688.1 hypothetical protein E3Q14_01146 [Wallemia mellicola]